MYQYIFQILGQIAFGSHNFIFSKAKNKFK